MIALSIGKTSYDTTVPMSSFPTENTKNIVTEKIESSGGSACNVAHLFGKWNAEAYFSGVVGYDDSGAFIKKDLDASHVSTAFLETNYERKTTTSFILVNNANTSRTVVMVEPEVFHLKKNEYDIAADIVYSDGYEYSASVVAFNKYPLAVSVLGASLDNGSDPKEVLALAKHVKYLIVSLDFAESLTKLKTYFNNPQTLLSLYKELKERYPNQQIVVTLKNMGAMYQIGEEVKVMPTIQVKEVDRTGAGDIFDGAFCYALGRKYDLEKSIRIANIAAGLSTAKHGAKASIPTLSEVIQYYEQKFGPLEEVQHQVEPNEAKTDTPINNEPSGTPPMGQ